MGQEIYPCPYVGLRPFRESDYQFFFGRDRDVRVISSNLQAQLLTVLYGASGVGKSSVLQAGVMPYLKTVPHQAVVYFNEWQSPTFLSELTGRCACAVPVSNSHPNLRLDQTLAGRDRVFLLLDQFEDFLFYHQQDCATEFEGMLARIVNSEDIAARVLIGIREDALSRLDQRFGIRIPNLLGNTLALQHLNVAAAREAIRRPINVLNSKHAEVEDKFEIEDELIEEIVRQVRAGQVSTSESSGLGTAAMRSAESRIETAFLQLVLTRLWTEEAGAGSRKLRLGTLAKIGGAASIVQKHVAGVMAQFGSNDQRDVAAAMFRYLVTPSRTKIVQATPDLVSYAEAPAAHVRNVLSMLSDRPEARILRRLENPERYEIFHDVLAQPILDWRRDYLTEKERAAEQELRAVEAERQRRELDQTRALAATEQRRAEEQARSAARLRWGLAAVIVVLLLATGAAIYAFQQRHQARESARKADSQRELVEAARAEAFAAQKASEARRSQLETAQAEAAGNKSEAERLRFQTSKLAAEAQAARQEALYQRKQLDAANEGLDRSYRDALQQTEELRKQLKASEEQRSMLQAERDQLLAQLGKLTSKGEVSPPPPPLNDAAQHTQQRDLKIEKTELSLVILDGDGAINTVRQRIARDMIIEVRGPGSRPIQGALVTFILPHSGPGGAFGGGDRTLTVMTDSAGRARATGFRPNNISGTFIVQVQATYKNTNATAAIHQSNAGAPAR